MPKHIFARPRKRTIDQQAIREFLDNQGFAVESITQEWRHLTAFGQYQGETAVFKLASTQKVSKYTENEYNWNEAVTLSTSQDRRYLRVPRNLAAGQYGHLFYSITEKFSGESLAAQYAANPFILEPYLPIIAAMSLEIAQLRVPATCRFAQAQPHSPKQKLPVGQRLLHSATEWAAQVPVDLDRYLQILTATHGGVQAAPMHGDLVLRHLFVMDKKTLGLIDGEHATLKGAKHYDLAHFFIRLCSDHSAVTLARHYLEECRRLLPAAAQKIFWEELKPLLIQRYIGGLWDVSKNPEKLAELSQVGPLILEDRVLAS